MIKLNVTTVPKISLNNVIKDNFSVKASLVCIETKSIKRIFSVTKLDIHHYSHNSNPKPKKQVQPMKRGKM